MKRFVLVLLVIVSRVVLSEAQEAGSSIAGRMIEMQEMRHLDSVIHLDFPIVDKEIMLVIKGDTLKTKTNSTGSFSFKELSPGPVRLMTSYLDYEPFSESIDLVPGENVVIIPFSNKIRQLNAAVVTDEIPAVIQHGDTLIYNAVAVALQSDDFAIDMLSRFPGVELKNGQIVIVGKAVRRSYVNGALVFGLDPMASVENLKADQVVTMEVYDEKDPQEVLDGIEREKQRVINIRTKEPIFSTTDLQVRAIAGADQQRKEDSALQYRYAAGTNAHFFSELKQLSADFVTNNVGLRSSAITLAPGPQSSYRENSGISLGFSRFWVSPLYGNGISVSYTYEQEKTRSRRRRLEEYFEIGGIPGHTVEDESVSSGSIGSHSLHTVANYRTGDHLLLQWTQNFRLSQNRSNGQTTGLTSYLGHAPMTRNEVNHSGTRQWELSEDMSVQFKSRNGKALPRINLYMQVGRNDLDSWNLDTLSSSYTRRFLTKEGNTLSQEWRVSTNKRLYNYRKERRVLSVTGRYSISYSLQNRKQQAYDWPGFAESAVNVANTYDFTYSGWKHNFSLESNYQTGWETVPVINFLLTFSMDRIKDRERLPASMSGNKTYVSVLPFLTFRLRSMTWGISSTTLLPSVEQLRRRIDDTYPLALIAGNPDLKQMQSWRISVGKNVLNGVGKWRVTWSANIQYDRHPIVHRTLFYRNGTVLDDYDGYDVPAGASLLRSENADYALRAGVSMNASSRMSLLSGRFKPSVTVIPNLSFRLTPQYFGELLDRTTEWTPRLTMTITAPLWKSATVSFSEDLSYIRAKSGKGQMDRSAVRSNMDLEFKADFLRHAYFSGTYTWQPFRDLAVPSRNMDIQRLNVSAGIYLMKKTLKIGIRGVDLLRGGSVYNIFVGPSSITHSWTPVYGRYFLLDISFRFNNSGGKTMPRYGF